MEDIKINGVLGNIKGLFYPNHLYRKAGLFILYSPALIEMLFWNICYCFSFSFLSSTEKNCPSGKQALWFDTKKTCHLLIDCDDCWITTVLGRNPRSWQTPSWTAAPLPDGCWCKPNAKHGGEEERGAMLARKEGGKPRAASVSCHWKPGPPGTPPTLSCWSEGPQLTLLAQACTAGGRIT